jgi:hypothetical protein
MRNAQMSPGGTQLGEAVQRFNVEERECGDGGAVVEVSGVRRAMKCSHLPCLRPLAEQTGGTSHFNGGLGEWCWERVQPSRSGRYASSVTRALQNEGEPPLAYAGRPDVNRQGIGIPDERRVTDVDIAAQFIEHGGPLSLTPPRSYGSLDDLRVGLSAGGRTRSVCGICR